MGQPQNNFRMDSNGRIINDAEHNRNDLQELVRLTGMTQPIMGFVTISSDDKEAGMKKVTREEFEKSFNRLSSDILELSIRLYKRIEQLESSDMATATRISTLLERTERLEEPTVPRDHVTSLIAVKAFCIQCGKTVQHNKTIDFNKEHDYFKCTKCGYKWY